MGLFSTDSLNLGHYLLGHLRKCLCHCLRSSLCDYPRRLLRLLPWATGRLAHFLMDVNISIEQFNKRLFASRSGIAILYL